MATSDAASNGTPTDTTMDTTTDAPSDAPEAVDDAPQPTPSATTTAKPLRRGLAQAVVLGAFGLDMLLYTLVVPFLPARAQALGATPAVTGALFACYAAGLFVATPPSGWLTDRAGARRTLLGGLLALFAATLLFAYAPGLPLLFAARAAQGVSGAVTWTAGLALIAQLYAPDERQKVFASIFTVTGLGTLIGPPLGGALYTLGGFRTPFLFAAALVVLDGLGRVLFLPGKRAVDAASPTPAPHGSCSAAYASSSPCSRPSPGPPSSPCSTRICRRCSRSASASAPSPSASSSAVSSSPSPSRNSFFHASPAM